jgi:D-alanyl-D-alanine carboxypeptidase/D-alanyl-D-alanine-endopeptidase (penicillin-binding protein 4)
VEVVLARISGDALMRGIRLALALFVLQAAGAATAPTAPTAWPALTELARSGAQVSAAAIDLDRQLVIDELHGDTRLTPASLTKLVTAAVALGLWAPDKLFHTRLLASGATIDGVLRGDLILLGAGDPSLDDQSLWNLAAQLRGAGVTHVHGRLVVVPSPFGLVTCETQDRCDAMQRSDHSYNAPLGAVGVDFGNWCLMVRPVVPGEPAAVQGCGVTRLPISVEGTIHTVSETGRQTFWLERMTDAAGDHLRIGGDIPSGPAQQVYRAMSDPVRGSGLLLKQMLRETGLAIDGDVVTGTDLPTTTRLLADVQGLALSEQLGRMLRYSNNYIADVLTLDAAAESGTAPTQLSGAASILSDFVAKLSQPAGRPPLLHSGSGLTPENALSAHDLTTVLASVYRDTRRFPSFYGGLIVPRDAPFGFLREGGDAWLDRVALKTGSMDDPHSVLGIAGYLRKRNGGWIAFAAIINGGPTRPHVPLREALAAARADIEALLAKY